MAVKEKDVGLTVDKCAAIRKFQLKNSSYQFIRQQLIWSDLAKISGDQS